MQMPDSVKMTEEDAIVVLNIENLRLSLLTLTNMCLLSLESKKQFLQFDETDEKKRGAHFIVLLGWFLVDDYELIFENFAPLLNALTEDDALKEFLLSPAIRLETRLKRYLLHSNNLIRGAVLQCIKHLFFSHDDPHLTERFCKFEADEAHVGSTQQILELNTRCLYLALQQKYQLKEEHKKVAEKYLGTIWKPIKSLKV